MISQTAEYALRATVFLAEQYALPSTTQQIADATHVPAGYLSKTLQQLVRAGIVTSQRGLNGGFVLARHPDRLSLFDVVHVVDPSRRIRTCPLGIHGTNLCALHRQLDDAARQMEETFRRVSVADLLRNAKVIPLQPCESAPNEIPVTLGVPHHA